MKATDKDQFDSTDNPDKNQSPTGSEGRQEVPQPDSEGDTIGSSFGEGKPKKLPSKDENNKLSDDVLKDKTGGDQFRNH